MRFRTIEEAYNIIRTNDPDTALSKEFFRELCRDGVLDCLSSGNKRIVDIDTMEEKIKELIDCNNC
jgi:hypothetical protein